MVEKTFFQWLFRVPVAPVGTNIHKKDDFSWLQSSDDSINSISISSGSSSSSSGTPEIAHPTKGDDPYTHPYDREVRSDKKKKKKKQAEFSTLHSEPENQ